MVRKNRTEYPDLQNLLTNYMKFSVYSGGEPAKTSTQTLDLAKMLCV
ncbi:hypothetical protein Nwat_1395 [Nitrosococcus watsonii C-113]|uniref:Uncharacterized protein n=1 Tax=Nitrosococcus watsoni (strain C-113) TaxID=105559 RepID=D8K5Y3_NITWC|nr:hypothetical protein Nwat_1395 [Nitrosococcus watsonii C-113]